MRWLWQLGGSWLRSHLMGEAKRAAAEHLAPSDAESTDTSQAKVAVAVVCETKRLFDAVADQLSGHHQLRANGFVLSKGKLAKQTLVVVRPMDESANHRQLVAAVVDGHQPDFILSASDAVSTASGAPLGGIVIASRLRTRDGGWMNLDGRSLPVEGISTGIVTSRGATGATTTQKQDEQPLAEDNWTEPIARACQHTGTALMAAAVVIHAGAEQRSAEAAALESQSTVAGRAGVLAGMLWKKRSGLKEVWGEKEAAWEASVRLAKLVEYVVGASGN